MENIFSKSAKSFNDSSKESRSISIPIYQTATFQARSSLEHGYDYRIGKDTIYTRLGNPTLTAASKKICELENAEAGLVFSSGMAAIATTLLTYLKKGDHIIVQREIFVNTFQLLTKLSQNYGVEVDFVDLKNENDIKNVLKQNTKAIYIESPSNPILKIVDIKEIAKFGASNNLLVIIDSTLASPYCQNPINLGASIVIHSATKYLSGHSDLMCGAVVGKKDLIGPIKEMQVLLGCIMDPHAAWLLLRGIKTLAVRMEKTCSNALAIARYIANQKCVKSVSYPLLETGQFFELAKNQMTGGGGVVAFEVEGLNAARKFVNALREIPIATSLGGVETLVEVPYDLDFNEEEFGDHLTDHNGVTPGFIRLSVGIEDLDDLIQDLQNGFDALQG